MGLSMKVMGVCSSTSINEGTSSCNLIRKVVFMIITSFNSIHILQTQIIILFLNYVY